MGYPAKLLRDKKPMLILHFHLKEMEDDRHQDNLLLQNEFL